MGGGPYSQSETALGCAADGTLARSSTGEGVGCTTRPTPSHDRRLTVHGMAPGVSF
jgi:hypothetical protein